MSGQSEYARLQATGRIVTGLLPDGESIYLGVSRAWERRAGREYTFAQCVLRRRTTQRALLGSVDVIFAGHAESAENTEYLAEMITVSLTNMQRSTDSGGIGTPRAGGTSAEELRTTLFQFTEIIRQFVGDAVPIFAENGKEIVLTRVVDVRAINRGVAVQLALHILGKEAGSVQVHTLQMKGAETTLGSSRLDEPASLLQASVWALKYIWGL